MGFLFTHTSVVTAWTACLQQQQPHCSLLTACCCPSSPPPTRIVLCCRCCAERNLLNAWVLKASRQNVARHQVVHWIRRKAGAELTVWRELADGTLGASVPCCWCKAFLDVFDLRVRCVVSPGEWFSGRLTDQGAPVAKLTSGQRRMVDRERRESSPGPSSKERRDASPGLS